MQQPIAERIIHPSSDTRASAPSAAVRADRGRIDCGGGADPDQPTRARYDDRADVRRAMDARRGTYADQVQAI